MLGYFGNYDIDIHFMLTFNLESTDVHLESTVSKLCVQREKNKLFRSLPCNSTTNKSNTTQISHNAQLFWKICH